MGRFVALVQKDAKVIVRNRGLLLTLLLYPLVLVLVLGLVFADPGQPIPVGVVIGGEGNEDIRVGNTTFSVREVIEDIDQMAHAREFSGATVEEARERAVDALRKGEVDAVVVFPDDFLADLLQDFRTRAEMEVILDSSDPAKSMMAQNVIRAGVQQFNQDIVAFKVDEVVDLLYLALEGTDRRLAGDMNFRELRDLIQDVLDEEQISSQNRRDLEDAITFLDTAIWELEDSAETIESIAFPILLRESHVATGVLQARDVVVPATVALSIFWTGILATASLVVYERQSHAQLRLNVTPVRPFTVLSAKLVVAVAIILLQSGLIIGIARTLWAIRLDNPALLLVMLLASAFAAVGLGLLVAGLSRDTNGSTLLSVLAVFPMMFLSGLFFPVSFMPQVAQALAHAMPMMYAVEGLRGAMLRDWSFAEAGVELAFLIILGAVALVVGHHRNRRLGGRM
jgi:ABC-type multidrug transport system permease subunit